jgi:hypothetical protein
MSEVCLLSLIFIVLYDSDVLSSNIVLYSLSFFSNIFIGQQTLRSYWRNYYEQTDGLIFVIDSADRERMNICAQELKQLLKQEVS